MIKPININSQGTLVDLKTGRYYVFLLGGWKVELGDFSINIKNVETNENVNIKKPFLPVQTIAYNRRAKRVSYLNIVRQGKYQINFQNPDSLHISHSNLFFFSKFYPPRLNKEIDILITTKSGFQLFIR